MKEIDVIIFSGQSNMQGESETCLSDAVVEDAYEYRWLTDTLEPLKNPVGEHITNEKKPGKPFRKGIDNFWDYIGSHATGAACNGCTNLVPTFCETYREKTGKPVLAIHVAMGSSQIHEWLPGTPRYEILVEKATAGIKKISADYQIDKIYFVWLQGESDAIAGNSKAYYKEKITTLCEAVKKDLQIEKFGVIRVGRFTNDEKDLEIIAAQDEICAEHPDFVMLTTITTELNQMPEYMNQNVAGHYSAKGLERIGRLAGSALAEI